MVTSASTKRGIHTLRDVTLRTKQRDPRRQPDEQFTYIDVSSVSNERFRIEQTSTFLGANAPSRARKTVQEGDVLFATVRPSLRRIALVPAELDGAICSTAFTVLRPNPEAIHPDFLYYQVLTDHFADAVVALQRGSSYPAVSDSDVFAQMIALPTLEEQRRIARILSAIERAKGGVRNYLRAIEDLRRSVVVTMFTPTDDWRQVRLGDEITLQRGHDLPTQNREPGEVPVVSSSGITGWHCSAKADGPGVVIGRYGTLGVVQFLEGPYWPLNTTLYVKDFHGNEPRFVRYFLETVSYEVHNDKTSVPGVNRNDLHALEVCWPPLADQERIAAALDRVGHRLASEQEVARALDVVFRSALSKLMAAAA